MVRHAFPRACPQTCYHSCPRLPSISKFCSQFSACLPSGTNSISKVHRTGSRGLCRSEYSLLRFDYHEPRRSSRIWFNLSRPGSHRCLPPNLQRKFKPYYMRQLAERISTLTDNERASIAIRLFWAREDVLVPASFGPRYQKLLPSAELIWFDQASHFLQVDDPTRTVQEIMRFDER